MKNTKKIGINIFSIIFWVIMIIILTKLYSTYKTYYYNGFSKAEYNIGVSKFTRDKYEKYSEDNSYKIESLELNDAMFYKQIKVKKDTPYKVTCMIKTKDIVNENEKSESGAMICLVSSTETTKGIKGTNDWQKVELIFNSKNRETIDIGFRLGGNIDNSTGTAWFTDFKLEEGSNDLDFEWNFACFIIKNVDVNIDGKEEKLSMSLNDEETLKTNMDRFQKTCKDLSNNKMSVNYDIYKIDEPITSITYSETFGYYIDPNDVKELLSEYITNKEYDHIFVCVRLGNSEKNIEIPVYDWIGLGGMELNEVGFSNIRLPNSNNNYIYTYSPNINIFPEEVFVHEFLHSLEKTLIDREYEIPALHDNLIYGYEEKQLIGLKEWYKDYMCCSIYNPETQENIGLDSIVYNLKPPHESNFKNTIEIELNKEPQNIIEEIRAIFVSLGDAFNNINTNYERNSNESIGI